MSNIVKINNTELKVIEFQGQRVATLAQIDEVHDRPEGTAGRTLRDHRHRLVEGEDFFEIDQPDEIRRLGFERPQGGTPGKVILMTEQGYTMLVKPFTDDLAWQVQRQVVTGYFRAKEAAALPSPAKAKPTSPLKIAVEAAKAFPPLLRAGRLLGLDKNAATIAANNAVFGATQVNLMQLLGHTHLEAENQEAQFFTPTELGRRIGTSARGVNLLLAGAGLQMKRGEVWEATEAGREFCRLYDTGKKHGSGVPVTQMKWSPNVLPLLGEQREVA